MRSPQRENADKDNAPPLTAEARIATAGDVGGARDRRRLAVSGCDGDWSVSPAPPLPFLLRNQPCRCSLPAATRKSARARAVHVTQAFRVAAALGGVMGGTHGGVWAPAHRAVTATRPPVAVAAAMRTVCVWPPVATPTASSIQLSRCHLRSWRVRCRRARQTSLVGRGPWMARLTLRPAPVQLEC